MSEERPKTRRPKGRFEYERGIRYSDLEPLQRLLALTLATWSDAATGVIPDWAQPALSVLVSDTGMPRSSVAKHLRALEERGWIVRSTGGGRGKRTRYLLTIPVDAKTSRETDDAAPETVRDADSNDGRNGETVRHTDSKGSRDGLFEPGNSPRGGPTSPSTSSPSTSTSLIARARDLVTAANVVADDERDDFLSWINQKFEPRTTKWWETVAASEDGFKRHADDWRASKNGSNSGQTGTGFGRPRHQTFTPAASSAHLNGFTPPPQSAA